MGAVVECDVDGHVYRNADLLPAHSTWTAPPMPHSRCAWIQPTKPGPSHPTSPRTCAHRARKHWH